MGVAISNYAEQSEYDGQCTVHCCGEKEKQATKKIKGKINNVKF